MKELMNNISFYLNLIILAIILIQTDGESKLGVGDNEVNTKDFIIYDSLNLYNGNKKFCFNDDYSYNKSISMPEGYTNLDLNVSTPLLMDSGLVQKNNNSFELCSEITTDEFSCSSIIKSDEIATSDIFKFVHFHNNDSDLIYIIYKTSSNEFKVYVFSKADTNKNGYADDSLEEYEIKDLDLLTYSSQNSQYLISFAISNNEDIYYTIYQIIDQGNSFNLGISEKDFNFELNGTTKTIRLNKLSNNSIIICFNQEIQDNSIIFGCINLYNKNHVLFTTLFTGTSSLENFNDNYDFYLSQLSEDFQFIFHQFSANSFKLYIFSLKENNGEFIYGNTTINLNGIIGTIRAEAGTYSITIVYSKKKSETEDTYEYFIDKFNFTFYNVTGLENNKIVKINENAEENAHLIKFYILSNETGQNRILSCNSNTFDVCPCPNSYYAKKSIYNDSKCYNAADKLSSEWCLDNNNEYIARTKYYYVENGINKCIDKCKKNNFLFAKNKTCVTSCPKGYPYSYENKTCLASCDKFFYVKDDIKYCIDSCNDDYPFHSNETDNQCLDECPTDKSYYYKKNDNYYCFGSCNSTYKFISGKECKSNCKGFQYKNLTDDIIYCVDNCLDLNASYLSYENNKTCLTECKSKILKMTSNKLNLTFCLDTCEVGPGYFIKEQNGNECLTICNQKKYVNQNGTKFCLENCGTLNRRDIANECVDNCSASEKFYTTTENGIDLTFCLNNCEEKGEEYKFNEFETQRCLQNYSGRYYIDNENGTKYISIKNCRLSSNYFYDKNDGTDECASECPNSFYYKDENDSLCINSCNDEFPMRYPDEFRCYNICPNKFFNNSFCIDECKEHTTYIYLKNESSNECVSKCENKFYNNNGNKICIDSCEDQNIYNKNLFNSNECLSQCLYSYIIDKIIYCADSSLEDSENQKESLNKNLINYIEKINIDDITNNETIKNISNVMETTFFTAETLVYAETINSNFKEKFISKLEKMEEALEPIKNEKPNKSIFNYYNFLFLLYFSDIETKRNESNKRRLDEADGNPIKKLDDYMKYYSKIYYDLLLNDSDIEDWKDPSNNLIYSNSIGKSFTKFKNDQKKEGLTIIDPDIQNGNDEYDMSIIQINRPNYDLDGLPSVYVNIPNVENDSNLTLTVSFKITNKTFILKDDDENITNVSLNEYLKNKEKNVNIFNPKDAFFTDKCYLHNNFSSDMTLVYKNTKIYNNITFNDSINDCIFKEINSDGSYITYTCPLDGKINYKLTQGTNENPPKHKSVLTCKPSKMRKKLSGNLGIIMVIFIIVYLVFKMLYLYLLNNKKYVEIIHESLLNDDLLSHRIKETIQKNSDAVSEKSGAPMNKKSEKKTAAAFLEIFKQDLLELHPLFSFRYKSVIKPQRLNSLIFILNIVCIIGFTGILYAKNRKLIDARADRGIGKNISLDYPLAKEFVIIICSIVCSCALNSLIRLIFLIPYKNRMNLKRQIESCISIKDVEREVQFFIKKNEMRRFGGTCGALVISIIMMYFIIIFCGFLVNSQIGLVYSCIWSLLFEWVIFSNVYIAVISCFKLFSINEEIIYYFKQLFIF